jgi:glycosyltransferase involved in cell wall biosynthesis
MSKILSVVVPAYNEEKTILLVIDRLTKILHDLDYEIVIVDDASHDRTANIVSELIKDHNNIRLFRHEQNQGKTQALKTGFCECQGDIVIVQDADLEYNPADMLRVISPIVQNTADVVYGSRLLNLATKESFMAKSYFANRVITFFSNLFTKFHFSDVETCYKAFRREIIQNMVINSTRFGFEIEVTAKISKLNVRITEVPISFLSRSYADGKKIGVKDGIQALFYIVKYNLFTSKKRSFKNVPNSFI